MEIRASTDLRNSYKEISKLCKDTGEPIYLTNNGKGDLVIMSIEAFAKQQEILEFKHQFIEREISRMMGEKQLSLDEFDSLIKKEFGF